MPMYFQKTENALKRAREFIEVDKKESALECLNDVIHSKKHRQTWTTTHEHIMKLFVELCVDLQRSAFAKDGLYQYRNICREVSLHSFEVVVKYFLTLASDRASAAREESEQAVLQEVEDLDIIMTPENLLLSTVSGEGVRERSDRVLLAPWVKFLWESHRNMLELLKNNNTIEKVYADVAKEAFKFCLNYQRRTEFRKLCEILKNHLLQAQKYQTQSHSLRFDNPDTIQFLVDIRFEQLECSINVDLWQEAFKAIEEIHNLLERSGKTPRAGLLDNYYSRQVKVYWMANNKLFHAAALHKLFVLWKEQKKTVLPADLQRIASRVLLATLCVPIEPTPSDVDRFLEVDQSGRDKARRLAALLRMTTLPTRASLLRDLGRYNILQHTPPELQQLYSCLEVEFCPLQLCKKACPVLEGLEEDELFKQYVEPAKEVLLVRLIKEVSQVYETVKLDWLAKLAPFITPTRLETVVIETAHSNGIQVHIDHQTNCLRFGSDMSFSYRNETPEGPYVQPMPSEALCGQLQVFSTALQQAVQIIAAKETELEHAATMRELSQSYLEHCRADHRNMLTRKQMIEARKEYIESQSRAKELKESQERHEKEQQERKAEMERLHREAEERAESKKKKEWAERKRIEREQRIESLKKTAIGVRALETITADDLDMMDVDDIMAKQLKLMEKEMREKETKLRTQEKKIDHWERAKRIVEIPLLEKQYQQQIVEDRAFHKQQEEERVVAEIGDRKEKEENRERMGRMEASRDEFLEQIRQERFEAQKVKLKEFEAMLEVARAERLAKRKLERKAKRKAEAAALKKAEEEKEMRGRQEAEKAQIEEERRARQEALEAQLKKQREREEEIEAKQRRRDEAALQAMEERRSRATRDEGEWRTPAGQQDSWRREEPDDRRQQNWRDRGEFPEERGREERGGYPSPRTGAYRLPMRRDGGGSWRSRQEEEVQRGPEREEGDLRRPQGILKGEGGREREPERERGVSWEDERKPPPESDRGGREKEEGDRGGWRRGQGEREPDSSPRMYRDSDRKGYGEREQDTSPRMYRDSDHKGYGERERDSSPRMYRDSDRKGYGEREQDTSPRMYQDSDRKGYGERERDSSPRMYRDSDRKGYGEREQDTSPRMYRDSDRRGYGGEYRERGDWRGGGRDNEWRRDGRGHEGSRRERDFDRRGRDEGERDQDGGLGRRDRDSGPRRDGGDRRRGGGEDYDRGGWRPRDGDTGGSWRSREPDSDRSGGGRWRGREDESGGGWTRGGRTDRGEREGGWRDRERDRDRDPREAQREGRPPPRRDDWQRNDRDGGKATSSPDRAGQPRSGEEGWEVVGRKR